MPITVLKTGILLTTQHVKPFLATSVSHRRCYWLWGSTLWCGTVLTPCSIFESLSQTPFTETSKTPPNVCKTFTPEHGFSPGQLLDFHRLHSMTSTLIGWPWRLPFPLGVALWFSGQEASFNPITQSWAWLLFHFTPHQWWEKSPHPKSSDSRNVILTQPCSPWILTCLSGAWLSVLDFSGMLPPESRPSSPGVPLACWGASTLTGSRSHNWVYGRSSGPVTASRQEEGEI